MNAGEQMTLELLKQRAVNGFVKLHSKEVERDLIPKGKYCLSVSKYCRNLRAMGEIEFPDPRANEHFYLIRIIDKTSHKYDTMGQGVLI